MQNTKDMTPIEIALGVDEDGCTTAKKLYAFLGLNPGHYSRWCKSKITENDSVTENVDYWVSTINGEHGGQASMDYRLTFPFAKKLAMRTNNERGEQIRQYLSGISDTPEVPTDEDDVQALLPTQPANNVSIIEELARNPIEHNGVKVITTKLLAQIYETSEDVIRKNFNNNKIHFIEGKHYFRLEGRDLAAFKESGNNIPAPALGRMAKELILWTHEGASLHCKPLGTDRAWDQFDELADGYFLSNGDIEAEAINAEAQTLLAQIEIEKRCIQETKARIKLIEEQIKNERQFRETLIENERQLRETEIENERQLREAERQILEAKIEHERQLQETERQTLEAKIESERQLNNSRILLNQAQTIWNDPTLTLEQRRQKSLNLYMQHGIPVTNIAEPNVVTDTKGLKDTYVYIVSRNDIYLSGIETLYVGTDRAEALKMWIILAAQEGFRAWLEVWRNGDFWNEYHSIDSYLGLKTSDFPEGCSSY